LDKVAAFADVLKHERKGLCLIRLWLDAFQIVFRKIERVMYGLA
jgi:hypothetical protein